MASAELFVGIDVSKAELEVYEHPTDVHWSVSNDPAGHEQLVRRLTRQAPWRVFPITEPQDVSRRTSATFLCKVPGFQYNGSNNPLDPCGVACAASGIYPAWMSGGRGLSDE